MIVLQATKAASEKHLVLRYLLYFEVAYIVFYMCVYVCVREIL